MDRAMVIEPTEAAQICLLDLILASEDRNARIKKFTTGPGNRPPFRV